MKTICVFFIFFSYQSLWAQTQNYTPLNGHSHNDYQQKQPFETAFEAGMGSIEADVFLKDNALYVAHTRFKIKQEHTLEVLYLQPIAQAVRQKQAYPVQILIDIKTEAEATLAEIIRQLAQYPDVFNEISPIKIIISGHRPKPATWQSYPSFILFDGRIGERYSPEEMQRIGIMSDKYKRYKCRWHRRIDSRKVMDRMETSIETAHCEGKKIRFWATPDNPKAWRTLMQMGVDFINTNKPKAFRVFLSR